MSENKNFDENIELDELNIKSHLNDSLDLSGIRVSEDLINRTLLAIKKQSETPFAVTKVNESLVEDDTMEQTTEDNLEQRDYGRDETGRNKKVIQWNRYLRAFAGVAAAVVVLAVGYGLASNGAFSGYKTSNSEDQAYDMLATKEAVEENANADLSDSATIFQGEESSMNSAAPSENGYGESTTTTDGTQAPNSSEDFEIMGGETEKTTGKTDVIENPKYSITAEVPMTARKDSSEAAGSSSDSGSDSTISADKDKSTIQSTEPSQKSGLKAQETAALSFRDIFLADPSEASSLTITDERKNITIVLTKKEDIQSFYKVMEQHQYTYGDQATNTANFSLEIATPTSSMVRYTMYVGESIVVDYADDVTSSRSVYTTSTLVQLSAAIQEFCKKYQ